MSDNEIIENEKEKPTSEENEPAHESAQDIVEAAKDAQAELNKTLEENKKILPDILEYIGTNKLVNGKHLASLKRKKSTSAISTPKKKLQKP